jgi:hypothetical protein
VDPSFPAEPIARYSPGTDSGTFDYFVEAVFDEDDAPDPGLERTPSSARTTTCWCRASRVTPTPSATSAMPTIMENV